jgi:hypothetical protein
VGKAILNHLTKGEFRWNPRNALVCVAAKDWILGTFVAYVEEIYVK